MSIGTRSILYGAHCFFIHPWFVLAAWVKLYGWPKHLAYYAAFFLHDIGYYSRPNMDGPEGERHPETGAVIMSALFDRAWKRQPKYPPYIVIQRGRSIHEIGPWGRFVLYHSRFLAKGDGMPFSRLCVADKLAFALTPRWLYLPMVRATGEIHEYMKLAEQRTDAGEPKFAAQGQHHGDEERWFEQVKTYMTRWVEEHADGRPDTWTPAASERTAVNESGVWQ